MTWTETSLTTQIMNTTALLQYNICHWMVNGSWVIPIHLFQIGG